MTKDEMRMIRRNIISILMFRIHLDEYSPTLASLKASVRLIEFVRYNQELKAYA